MARKPISKDKLTEKYLGIYNTMTKDQPDMACAILVTAFIENALMTVLNDFLIQDKDITPILFKTNRPLGGFANCRDMAFCLGFVTKPMYDNLVIIGEIRNRFAHCHDLLTFDNDEKKNRNDKNELSVKGLCNKLRFPTVMPWLFNGNIISGEPPMEISPRDRFVQVSAYLFRRIEMIAPATRCSKRIEW